MFVNASNLSFFSAFKSAFVARPTVISSKDILVLRTMSFLRKVFDNCFLASCSSCFPPRMFEKEPIMLPKIPQPKVTQTYQKAIWRVFSGAKSPNPTVDKEMVEK